MGTWSSIRDFYRRWKPEIDLYGIGLLLLASAIGLGRMAAAGIVLAGVLIFDAVRRWGGPYLSKVSKEERLLQESELRAEWEEWFLQFYARLFKVELLPREKRRPVPPPAPATPLASDPPAQDEGESAESPQDMPDAPDKPAPAPISTVTHPT